MSRPTDDFDLSRLAWTVVIGIAAIFMAICGWLVWTFV